MYNDIIKNGINVFEDEINSLNTAKNRIGQEFAEAVGILSSANKIVLSGVGKSGLIARKIAATFSSIGVTSIFLHPVEALHGDIGVVQKGDVAILLSKSGTTDELVKLIPYLKMRDSKIISIIGNINSVIGRYSDIILDGSVIKEACPFNLAPTASSTLALVLGDALAISVMKQKKVSLEDFSKLHPLGQIGRSITIKVSDVMHTGTEIPLITKESSFRDALIEITLKDLGCVLTVDENNRILGIITDGDVRRILQSSDDIRGLVVGNIMTKSPITIGYDSLLHEALAVMENRESEINVLPVIDENKTLIGVVRLHDIVRTGV